VCPDHQFDLSLIEAVARALCEANGVNPDSLYSNKLGEESQLVWKLHVPQAQAAIKAADAWLRHNWSIGYNAKA
jgi:hypothetical protein